MRFGGILIIAAGAFLLGSCAETVKSCKDAVNVYFSRGFDQLNLDALTNVLLAVNTLNACPAARAMVTGHIDGAEIGTPRLGLSRAANVRSVMTKNGIDRSRITVRDAGLSAPDAPADEPSNRFVAIEWR